MLDTQVETRLAAQLGAVPGLVANVSQTIAAALTYVCACCYPEQVILFGSRARGDAQPTSDIDLLVVLPDRVGLAGAWDCALRAVATLSPPVDIVVTTSEEMRWRSHLPFFVHHYASTEGVVLYERAGT
ncbi:MAG TPA: nucleotidyltransferase domain-containing protein [Chloroflexota bacterium]|nr:nucleotidyltransferase domain-containing protein [Chloroflexota bacterium]